MYKIKPILNVLKQSSIRLSAGVVALYMATTFVTACASEPGPKVAGQISVVLHRERWLSVLNLCFEGNQDMRVIRLVGNDGVISSWESFPIGQASVKLVQLLADDLVSRQPAVGVPADKPGDTHGERDWFELEISRGGKVAFTACGEMKAADETIRMAVEKIEQAAQFKSSDEVKSIPFQKGVIRAVPLLDALRIYRGQGDLDRRFLERVEQLRADGVQITRLSLEDLVAMPSVALSVGMPRRYFPASDCGDFRSRTGGESNPFIETPTGGFSIEYYGKTAGVNIP